jgi:D-xylose transport system permease protein
MTVPTDDKGEEPRGGLATEPVHETHPGEKSEVVASTGLALPTEVVGSLREYIGAWGRRIRGGESGILPILAALILIVVVFQVANTHFLSPADIVNLLALTSIYVMFGMAETFALLLSEIDLSISYVGFVGAMVMTELMTYPNNWPWWAAVIVGMGVCVVIGLIQGTIISRLRIPSFIVTLAGFLFFEGFLIFVTDIDKAAVGGVLSIPSTNTIWGIVGKQMSPTVSWIVLVVALACFASYIWIRDARRRSAKLSAPPRSITALSILGVAVVAVAFVWICNINRSNIVVVRGVPYYAPVLIVVLIAWTVLLGRTRFGRYVYAIGANPEAARRAGIKVAWIRTAAFVMCSLTAGFAGIIWASRQGSMSIDVTGGQITLLGVAAAVIGGTSLFGGRGKMAYAVLGGLIVAAIDYGLGLVNVSAQGTEMAIGVVLVAAATVDTLVRRRRTISPV